jgi:hypothetical protein
MGFGMESNFVMVKKIGINNVDGVSSDNLHIGEGIGGGMEVLVLVTVRLGWRG